MTRNDSSHLTGTNVTTCIYTFVQFRFGTSHFSVNHHNKYSTEHIFTVYARLFKRFPLQCFILLYHNKNLLTWPEWLAAITTDTQAGRRSRFFNSEGGRRERCFPLWRPKWSQRLLQVHDALWYTVEFNYRNAFEGSGNERVLCLCTYCMYV